MSGLKTTDQFQVETEIAGFIETYRSSGTHIFSEPELHSRFYRHFEGKFEGFPDFFKNTIHPFRQAYPTIWGYRNGDGFAEKAQSRAGTHNIDFVLLNGKAFDGVFYGDANNENAEIQKQLQNAASQGVTHPFAAAIEIKMFRGSNVAEFNRLEDSLLESCRKLAAEQPRVAYLLAFGDPRNVDKTRSHTLVGMAQQIYQSRNPYGKICVAVVTPASTFLGGDWHEDVDLAKVVSPRWKRAEQQLTHRA